MKKHQIINRIAAVPLVGLLRLVRYAAALALHLASGVSAAAFVPLYRSGLVSHRRRGSAQTLDFDSLASGTTMASGSSVGGITFTYSIGPSMMVANDFLTTSGTNYLGLDDPGNYNQFIAGDEFTLSFASPVTALGMYFVSGDPLYAGDIHLITGAGTAFNASS